MTKQSTETEKLFHCETKAMFHSKYIKQSILPLYNLHAYVTVFWKIVHLRTFHIKFSRNTDLKY